MTQFTPEADGTFTYRARAGGTYRLDDPEAEATRIRWLAQYLGDNGLCANGYEITDRETVVVTTGMFGGMQDVIYRGECAQ